MISTPPARIGKTTGAPMSPFEARQARKYPAEIAAYKAASLAKAKGRRAKAKVGAKFPVGLMNRGV